MSNGNDDDNWPSDSKDKLKNDLPDRNNDLPRKQSPIVQLTKPRVSSASKMNKDQRSLLTDDPIINESLNENHFHDQHTKQRQSQITSPRDHNQLNKNKTIENQHLVSLQDEQYQEDNHPQSTNITHHRDTQKPNDQNQNHATINQSEMGWLDPQYNDADQTSIKKPDELEDEMQDPPGEIDEEILDRIQGSIIGMALGDALGAHVEFRPRQYMISNPVKDLEGGGTWGLTKGQFTDDTSMALCLANSLVARRDFIPYDQLVRYKWWYRHGYMSSTGKCFDIGAATSQSIREFEVRQKDFSEKNEISLEEMDKLSNLDQLGDFDVYCSEDGVAGNGALMRLAPVPLFFYRNIFAAIEFSGRSGQITHGDEKASDACRYYGALIVAALRGFPKDKILDKNFYIKHRKWFGKEPLHEDIVTIARGSYQKDYEHGYDQGIRGKGYIVNALEAALWAFWIDEGSFEKGALAAVNLGDDTDTTAAIYGQLAGAHYGYSKLPSDWLKHVYAHKFMKTLSKWIFYEGEKWIDERENSTVGDNKGTQ